METLYLIAEDIKAVESLEKQKFLTWEWNYGNSPEFNITKSMRLNGGNVEIKLNVKNGIITGCSFFGDFFFSGDLTTFENAFKGYRFEKNEISRLLGNLDEINGFYNISKEDLLSCIFD
jgi:lipoate-protein ligase A